MVSVPESRPESTSPYSAPFCLSDEGRWAGGLARSLELRSYCGGSIKRVLLVMLSAQDCPDRRGRLEAVTGCLMLSAVLSLVLSTRYTGLLIRSVRKFRAIVPCIPLSVV